jgi:hypothetical protein
MQKYKFQWYQSIYENLYRIHAEARKVVATPALKKISGKVGLYAGSSACPGPLSNEVLKAIAKANRVPVYPLQKVGDELREVVKDLFGDTYDAAVTNTCEAGLRVVFETLFTPPVMRRGEAYRARFIAPYVEDYEFTHAYGRPFPPRYKSLFQDRSASSGELGFEGKSLVNLDALLVRLEGVSYEPHGIKYNPVPLMTRLDHQKSIEKIARVAHRHACELCGFATVSYDTPGYGGNQKDERGVPLILKGLAQLAEDYDLPFVIDSAASAPVFWPPLKDIGASVMLWSADKVLRAPTSGLIVGEEEFMVPVRKALGLGGGRSGGVSSHSKAAASLSDPGRDAVVGLLAALKTLRDAPEKIRQPIDQMHQIIVEEFAAFHPQRLRDQLIITKSYPLGGTEINYAHTWRGDAFGIPIFTAEDIFANTNPFMTAMDAIGIAPPMVYSGNIIITPGLGTLDTDGVLMEEPARLAVRAFVKVMEIVCKYAGLSV